YRHVAPSADNGHVRPWARFLLTVALVTHGYALNDMLFGAGGLSFGMADALSLTLWLTVLIYFVESFFARLEGLLTLAMPAAAVCAFLPAVLPGHYYNDILNSWAFRAHFIIAMLAYGTATLAALHALMMALAERHLHHAHLSPGMTGLPPLLTLENLLFRLIGTAFVLLTLTVGSGVLFSEEVFGKPLELNHKTVFTIASWLLFGVLLIGRRAWGWRGRTAQRWSLAGFVCLLLAYVGTRFVLEVLLHRG
ncbi:MAG TPA: cytochrome c biogenesis protein CcsA, partial [Rhodocyclaceae bacterium]|nr:cytochrome c biogenesis protein CcsA [Rhodocyclaceae bacterium]